MRAGIIEGLQTIRGPGKATPDACVVGRLACWQQYAHHPSSLSERQSRTQFGLNAHKLRRGSSPDQHRRPALATGTRLLLEAIASAGPPSWLSQTDLAEQRVGLAGAIVV